jgi:hypothetical protein
MSGEGGDAMVKALGEINPEGGTKGNATETKLFLSP